MIFSSGGVGHDVDSLSARIKSTDANKFRLAMAYFSSLLPLPKKNIKTATNDKKKENESNFGWELYQKSSQIASDFCLTRANISFLV